jgi:glycosyltransferase involved in cell wall biosynthesis
VKKLSQRPLIIRCSWARDLWFTTDGASKVVFDLRCGGYLEQMLIKKADVVYAPSNFVAHYYSKKYGLKVETLRPPFLLDAETATDLPWKLPKRFLFHFGTLGPIKGTDVLAAALPLVWREEPDFTMVWAGECRMYTARGRERRPDIIEGYLHAWGEKASQVMWLGEIKKPQLYAVLKRAEASILPSRCDNVPNTAIESLSLGIPVIGTRNSSIDELVEPGFSGELVPIGDPVALAEIMLNVWRRKVPWTGSGFRRPAILTEMDPHIAASNLLHLAGFND